MYRDQQAALTAQCESLRRQLDDATTDAATQAALRGQLEIRLRELERARLSEAEQEAAARGVGRRAALAGGLAGACLCAVAVALAVHGSGERRLRTGGARDWFTTVRPRCNSLEVGALLRSSRPPASDPDSAAYVATCQTLAGDLPGAQTTLDAVTPGRQAAAARILFSVVHPVADAGDDVAAGPAMELVLRYWPGNFQAVYHAGMSAHQSGELERAREHLRRFLSMYNEPSLWRRNAEQVLREIDRQTVGASLLP
jgi:TolA-binding protein